MKIFIALIAVCSAWAQSPEGALVTWSEWEAAFYRGIRSDVLKETVAALRPQPPPGTIVSFQTGTTSVLIVEDGKYRTQPFLSIEGRAGDGGWSFGGTATAAVESWGSLAVGSLPITGSLNSRLRLAVTPSQEITAGQQSLWSIRIQKEEAFWRNETLGLFMDWARLRRRVATAALLEDSARRFSVKAQLEARLGSKSRRDAERADWDWRKAVLQRESAEKELDEFASEREAETAVRWRDRKPSLAFSEIPSSTSWKTEAGFQAQLLEWEARRDSVAEAPFLQLKLEASREANGAITAWTLETNLSFSLGGRDRYLMALPEIRRLRAADEAERRDIQTAWRNGNRYLGDLEKQINLSREKLSRLEFFLEIFRKEDRGGMEEQELEREVILFRDTLGELEESRFQAAIRLKFILDAAGEL